MKRAVYIQTNQQQLLGALLARYALETHGKAAIHSIPVTVIEVEKQPTFQRLLGRPYRKGYAPYTFADLQSFTLTRFMPPELMGYGGRAVVIDPDIFALSDISPLFEILDGAVPIAACRKKDAWDTSVMVLDCAHLRHWRIADIISSLLEERRSYDDLITLRDEHSPIRELQREWNSLDTVSSNTKMLHTSTRLTQPWKTGLPIDFTLNPAPKMFGVLPRFWLSKPTHYQKHPAPEIERAFLVLLRDALADGALSDDFVKAEIRAGHIRKDIYDALAALS